MTRVVLHIGAFKTGTSFIQDSLFLNQLALADAGVLVPGSDWSAHVRAVRDLQRQVNQPGTAGSGWWARLVDSCRLWTGDTVVVSMEFLSTASPDVVRRAVAALHPLDVRIVLGSRDLTLALPAQWQESLQSGGADVDVRCVHELRDACAPRVRRRLTALLAQASLADDHAAMGPVCAGR